MSNRIDVRKTYKLFIGGAFPRSESGYSYVVNDHKGTFVANAALASRKDARDAVVAARKAFGGWSGRTAYNRAQILYRVAEVMEDRRPQFVQAVQQSEGLNAGKADKVVDAAVDRLVWYAGWADKLAQVVGNANPVAGPFFNLSTPEPTGVVAVLAPEESSLLGLVSVIAPVIVSGNTAVVVSSYSRPLPAVNLAEVLATSDLPGGVVEVGESPMVAVAREVEEELALQLPAGRLLLTDWLPPWGGWDDALCLVFDGGEHTPAILDQVVKQAREIRSARFCTLDEVDELCADFTARRVRAALATLAGEGSAYTESGR